MTNRPLAEQAVISALQAVAVDPHYTDFMRSMEQCWPELRQIVLPTVTIQNENAVATQPAMTVPHVNPLSVQPGHSRTVTIGRSRAPSRSSSSRKGGGERRPASRKRNDRSPTRASTSTMPPLTTRDSPSSRPPPDKRISNEEATPTSSERPRLPAHLISRKQRCWKHPCFLRHHQVNLVNHKDCRNHHLHSPHHANRWQNEQSPNHHLQSNRKRSLQSVIKARPKHKGPSKTSWAIILV